MSPSQQKILLVCDQPDLKELLSFQITSQFPVKVQECLSARDAARLLEEKGHEFALVVSPYNGPSSVLVKALREKSPALPVVFFFDPLVVVPEREDLKGIEVVGVVKREALLEGVMSAISAAIEGEGSGEQEFCPIRTNLLIRVSPLKSEIFIRLSDSKFVKLFRVGDEFDSSDLERYYQEKRVEYLYLRRTETAEFISKFRRELEDLLQRDDLRKEEAMRASEMAQEAIHELVNRIGFREEVQELAKRNVELTLKSIGANPRLVDLIDKIRREGNYVSQHSTLLAYVACCLAKEMEWGSEATFSKLVLAAYMHDISLQNPELAKVSTLRELEQKKSSFAAGEAKDYHLHPAKAADVVRSFKEVPADVDIIVAQHHERPNGGGFPRGLLFNYIAPLSSLFIVAHELSQALLFQGGAFSLSSWVAEKKPFFNQGNFKKVMAALDKVKL